MNSGACIFHASVQGAGAAAPTVPTTVFSSTSSIAYQARSVNYVSTVAGDITRSGAGVYTAKLVDSVPVVFDIIPTLWGADSKRVQVTGYNPSTRVISFQTTNAAGAATDIATTDFVKFNIVGTTDVPPY